MAITQETIPDRYHSAWHKVIYEMSSSIVANDEFKFVFVFTSALVNRSIKVSPRPGDAWGYLDARRHVQDMLNPQLFDIKETDVQAATYGDYSVRVNEEYKDGGGNIVTVNGPIIKGEALNFILNRNDILTYAEAKYQLLSSSSQFLWNIDNNLKVLKDDIFFIHFAIASLAQTFRFYVKEYFKNGTTNEFFTAVSATRRANLKTLDLNSVLTDPDNTTHIEVRSTDLLAADISETKTLVIEGNCSIYRRHRIIYLDAKGSYNSLNFDQVSHLDTKVTPKVYEKFINGASEVDTSRALTRYYVESEEVFTVNSTILTDKQMFADLIKSTDVWLDVRNDDRFPAPEVEFLPIEIMTPQVRDEKSENGELLQKTIQYKYSFEDVTR